MPHPHPKGDPTARALSAYFRFPEGPLGTPAEVRHVTLEGREYVALFDTGGATLAVYRIRNHDGLLRRMRRWPQEIEEAR